MNSLPKEYDDIPGTVVFDADRSRQGYHLNMFCMSLMKAENREVFRADEHTYLLRFPMTEEQRQAVLTRDWNRMIRLGGNIYFMVKLVSCDGKSVQHAAAQMSAMSQESYARMMINGGRSPQGNRYRWEQDVPALLS